MGAPLYHVSVPHHQDAVGIPDGGEPVGHHEAGLVAIKARMAAWIWCSVPCVHVEVASSRISMGVASAGPGNGQKLLLAFGIYWFRRR